MRTASDQSKVKVWSIDVDKIKKIKRYAQPVSMIPVVKVYLKINNYALGSSCYTPEFRFNKWSSILIIQKCCERSKLKLLSDMNFQIFRMKFSVKLTQNLNKFWGNFNMVGKSFEEMFDFKMNIFLWNFEQILGIFWKTTKKLHNNT